MAIPEKQLDAWTGIGSITGSANTYASIQKALAQHNWPKTMQYVTYLQGSYANSTNIRGDSDVDVVIEFNNVSYSNLTEAEKVALHLTAGAYNYQDCRKEVTSALQSYYGSNGVDVSGGKAIKVLPESGRLKADVLPCVTYKRYDSLKVAAEGITFWNQQNGQQVINYPKLHISNGESKNGAHRTGGWYKPGVRMLKNARNSIIGDSEELRNKFPSYFVECLFYNAPDSAFGKSWQETYAQVVNHFLAAFGNGTASTFTTQNQQTYLLGDAFVQWSETSASDFVQRLVALWNNWNS